MRARIGGVLLAAALLAGCTAQPLYSGSVAPEAASAGGGGRVNETLRQVNVAPVTTRQAQEVRNELIFQLSAGRGNPQDAPYSLALRAYSASQSSIVVNTTGIEQAPTSSVLTFVGSYTLTDASSGRVVGRGERRATASYDVPRQPLAAQRTVRDAENRAARELAAFIVAAVAADLATGQNVAVTPVE